MTNSKTFVRAILIAIGSLFVCFALVVSGEKYAVLLLGDGAKDLSWGAPLFRVLLLFHGVLLVVAGLVVTKPGGAYLTVNDSPPDNSARLALVVLIAAALVLRLWNLNADLWTDEVFTLLDFARQPFGEIATSFPSQNQHLLYSLLAHASLETFGETAWALRLPAVLFGAASIWALFLLCRKLLDRRTALLAAALMTVSYHHIWFSQNARGYTGLLFFTLLGTWLWFEALERGATSCWLWYAAAIVGGMWIHLTMAFVAASHFLVYMIFLVFPNLSGDEENGFSPERKAGFKPFAAWFLAATATVQLYALALPEFLRAGLHEESRNSEWTNPFWVVSEIFTNLSIGFAGIAVVFIGALFVAFGWLSLFGKNRRAALLMVLPPFLAGSLMLILGHNLFPRFFFFAMGFVLIIVVRGALELPKFIKDFFKIQNPKSKIQNRMGYAFVLLIIAASIFTVPRNYSLPKQDFSGAKNFVETNRSPNEEIFAVGIAGEIYGRYFARDWLVAESGAELENAASAGAKAWLVYTLAPEIKAFRPEMWRVIERDYETVRVFPGTLNGGEIVVCRRRETKNDKEKKEEKNETSRNINGAARDFVQAQTAIFK